MYENGFSCKIYQWNWGFRVKSLNFLIIDSFLQLFLLLCVLFFSLLRTSFCSESILIVVVFFSRQLFRETFFNRYKYPKGPTKIWEEKNITLIIRIDAKLEIYWKPNGKCINLSPSAVQSILMNSQVPFLMRFRFLSIFFCFSFLF